MSRLNEYNPEFGVVFGDPYEDLINSILNGTTPTGGGGTKPTGTTPTTPTTTFSQQSLQDRIATLTGQPGIARKEDLIARGGRELGNNIIVGNEKWSLRGDGTGLYGAFGTPSAADQRALGQQMMAQGMTNRTGAETANITPEARPYAGNAGVFGTLGPNQGPLIPGFDAYRQAGIGIPSEGRQTIRGIENGLNVMTAGRQGSATQFPVSPGFRGEGQYGNNINFVGGNANYLEPQMLFPDTSISVPGTYVQGQGNVGDSNRAYSVPFNIGGGGAALLNVGGNNVQLNSADRGTGYGYVLNAAPASSVFAATGRNPSEDPATQAAQALMLNSAIAQFGGGPGALQMVNAANGNQFSGYRAGTGNGFFSGNGGSGQGTYWAGYNPDPIAQLTGPVVNPAVAPVNYNAVGQGVASLGNLNGAIQGMINAPSNAGGMIGNTIANTLPTAPTNTGMPLVLSQQQLDEIMAQAQRDRDMAAAGGYGGDYTVADRGFAGGGRVAVRPLGGPVTSNSLVTPEPMTLVGNYTGHKYALMGEDNADPGMMPNRELLRFSGPQNSNLQITPLQPFAAGGVVTTTANRTGISGGFSDGSDLGQNIANPSDTTGTGTGPTQTGGPSNPPVDPTDTTDTGPVDQPPPPPAPPPVPPPPPPAAYVPTLAPIDTTVLAPWQQAQRDLAMRDAARQAYNYRFKAAGLSGPVALDVLQGDVPQNELPPGMYYDPSGQVNRVINQIIGTQSQQKELGAEEDISPVQNRATYIGNALDDIQRLRVLDDALTAAQGRSAVEANGNDMLTLGLQALQQNRLNLQLAGGDPIILQNRIKEIDSDIALLQKIIDNPTNGIVTANSGAGQGQIINAQIAAIKARLPKDANGNPLPESDLKTELAQLQDRISKNQKRIDLSQQVGNLRLLNVPKLNGPIISVPVKAA